MKYNENGLTSEETEIMDYLVAAYNKFNKLRAQNIDDKNDFRRCIHEQQRILATRAVARKYPEYWNTE
jgi:hypothetical protein